MHLGLIAVVIALAVPATGNGEWSVAPTPAKNPGPTPRVYFFLDASPGQTVKESVRVSNLSRDPRSFTIYGADAYNTARDGGFALRTLADRQTGVGSWVRSRVANVTVPGGTSADIPFTVTVPRNATPGDHVGGIVAMESAPGGIVETEDGATVRVQRAVAARIYLRVAGTVVPGMDVPSLTMRVGSPLLPVATGGDLEYTVANIGNVHLIPRASVTVTGLFGHAVKVTGGTPSADMVPGAAGTFAMRAEGVWPFDLVTTSVTVTADGGVYARRSDRALVVSWSGVAVLAALAAAVWWSTRRRVRSRQARPRGLVT
ncbi:DUF916 domain-containing protein [Actinoplanes sp. NPDC051861]|uniref:WxL protein peptidoglycan domain-containing protein n=1 Tax=Actinoplanes sp. NPDC051861 TaxID=3155170 RepID=UPI0034211161